MGRPRSCNCGKCKKCKHRIYMKDWYNRKSPSERKDWIAKRDKDNVRTRDNERSSAPKRRELSNKITKRWREENPDGYKAHKIVNNAVRDGRLLREPCEVCGNLEVHGHHDDYSKPLEVRWLCPLHHAEETVR